MRKVGPQAPGSDKQIGENDPAGESPKSEESDGGKGPYTSSPETESEKEPMSPLQSSGRSGASRRWESAGPQAPGSDKESGEKNSAGESPKSEESDGGKVRTHPPRRLNPEARVTLQLRGEGDHPGQGEESAVPEMPGSDKAAARKIRISGWQTRSFDLSKQPGMPRTPKKAILKREKGEHPGL